MWVFELFERIARFIYGMFLLKNVFDVFEKFIGNIHRDMRAIQFNIGKYSIRTDVFAINTLCIIKYIFKIFKD